ncbi:ABC-three component system protein [Microtetraspora malaysiensis]|uniref:ABC-three component system protein n=1 Tax=Microtetraspora malaysiensis TaxID=161358 RepID=A0ABW6SX39_9ACTN
MSGSSSVFDASASAIGYLYQLRYALLAGLNEFGTDASWSVSVEVVDDVEIVAAGESRRWQLKHRASGTRLTDGSTDLWKTLRIWSEAIRDGFLDPARTRLLLLTTSTVPVDSVAHYLQAGPGRDVERAHELLEAAATKSAADAKKKSIEAYRGLKDGQQQAMLAAITVLGDGPNIEDVHRGLLQICNFAVGKQAAESLLNRLEGWFIQRCIETMRGEAALPIPGSEIDEKFSELRDQFRPYNLPIDDDIAEMTATREEYGERTFIRQLDLIGLGNRRIELAVRDYLRASTQRSRWSRENLLLPGEIGSYERRLREEWETHFAVMQDELGEEAAEETKIAMAKQIYGWVETEFRRNIRPECHDPFICKGSFHILADDKRVGWHPDFEARLLAILEPVGGAVNAGA